MATTTLSDLVVAVGVPLRDNLAGTVSIDSSVRNQFVDSRRIAQTDDQWVGSEVLFLDTVGMTGPNPNRVTGFQAGSGTFILRDDYSSGAGPAAGTRYVMMKLRGQGVPFDYRIQAIRYVLESMADQGGDVELVLGNGIANTYQFTLPQGIDTVYGVRLRNLSGANFFDKVVKKRHGRGFGWELTPGRGLLVNEPAASSPLVSVVVQGRSYGNFDTSLTSVIGVSKDEVVRQAVEWLTMVSSNPAQARAHDNLMQERMRDEAEYWYANEERVR